VRIILNQINLATYLVEFQHVKIMKKIKTILLTFFLALVNVSTVLAGNPPPPQQASAQKSANTLDADDDPPTHPNLPIDQDLIYLAIGGLILGATVIYKNKIKKASM
jgi:hypothetical protein